MFTPEMISFHQCMHCGTLEAEWIDTCAKCLHTGMDTIQAPGIGKLVISNAEARKKAANKDHFLGP